MPPVDPTLIYHHNQKFRFNYLTELDVVNGINGIKSNAIGQDGISLKFVKILLPYIVSSLTHIFNHCINSSVFPDKWKIAIVMPIAKNNTASSPHDFRPISILPVLSKAFEKCLSVQIVEHLSTFNLLTNFQSGFRNNHSCTTALLKIFEDMRASFDRSEIIILILLDFTKAFDTVDHNILLNKLKVYFGFSDSAIALLRSYLENRQQRVKVDSNFSSSKCVRYGVPQGSILGPILFTLFINDIVQSCKNSSIHLYADDTQIYCSRPIGLSEDLVARLNEDLQSISTWATVNSLCLNASKSKAILISQSQVYLSSIPPIVLNGEIIPYERVVTSLGFKINSKLNSVDNVNNIIKKGYFVLRKLWHTAHFVPPETKMKLVRTLIVPLLTYGSIVYGVLDALSYHKLQLLLNNSARYIFSKSRYDHISEFSHQILNRSLANFLNVRNAIFLHKLLINKEPNYLYEKLVPALSPRTHNLIIPQFKYVASSRMFFVNAPKIWNSLPSDIKTEENFKRFKLAVLNYFS